MPSQVYTFERVASGTLSNAQSDAVNAIAVAAANEPGIRYEVMTDPDDPAPMIVVTCPDAASMHIFSRQLRAAVSSWGLQIRHVFGAEDESSPVD